MTARNQMEQRTRETVGARVALASAIVQTRPTPRSRDEEAKGSVVPRTAAPTLSLAAQPLTELAQSVLGCRQISIAALDAATGHVYPVTLVSLNPDEQQDWWASWSPPPLLEERYGVAIAALLHGGASTPLDAQHLPDRSGSRRGAVQSVWLVPMRLGEVLVGMLLVGYAEPDHAVSGEELALLESLARLGALVLEREQLRGEGWEAAYRAGRSLPFADVATLALTLLEDLAQTLAPPKPPMTKLPTTLDSPLSAREAEVLRLVAQGLTNKGIGRQLFIAASTVDYHLSAVFHKLGVDTRAQAVAVAAQRGHL